MQEWLARLRVQTLYITPGNPWVNGNVESLIGKLRDELLNGEFFTGKEAQVPFEGLRQEYNRIRPHSSLGYQPPATYAANCTHRN